MLLIWKNEKLIFTCKWFLQWQWIFFKKKLFSHHYKSQSPHDMTSPLIIWDHNVNITRLWHTEVLNYHEGLMSSINHRLKLTPPVSDLLHLVDCFTFWGLSQTPYYWITILASAFDMLWAATIGININEGFISEGRNLELVSKESFSGVTEILFCSTGPFYLPSGNGDL